MKHTPNKTRPAIACTSYNPKQTQAEPTANPSHNPTQTKPTAPKARHDLANDYYINYVYDLENAITGKYKKREVVGRHVKGFYMANSLKFKECMNFEIHPTLTPSMFKALLKSGMTVEQYDALQTPTQAPSIKYAPTVFTVDPTATESQTTDALFLLLDQSRASLNALSANYDGESFNLLDVELFTGICSVTAQVELCIQALKHVFDLQLQARLTNNNNNQAKG